MVGKRVEFSTLETHHIYVILFGPLNTLHHYSGSKRVAYTTKELPDLE